MKKVVVVLFGVCTLVHAVQIAGKAKKSGKNKKASKVANAEVVKNASTKSNSGSPTNSESNKLSNGSVTASNKKVQHAIVTASNGEMMIRKADKFQLANGSVTTFNHKLTLSMDPKKYQQVGNKVEIQTKNGLKTIPLPPTKPGDGNVPSKKRKTGNLPDDPYTTIKSGSSAHTIPTPSIKVNENDTMYRSVKRTLTQKPNKLILSSYELYASGLRSCHNMEFYGGTFFQF